MICENAAEEIGANGASLLFSNGKTGQIEVVASHGLSDEFIHKGPVEADKSIGDCLKGREVVVEDAAADTGVQYPGAIKAEGIESIICIPLKLRNKVVGALRAYAGYKCKPVAEDFEFLHALADFGVIPHFKEQKPATASSEGG